MLVVAAFLGLLFSPGASALDINQDVSLPDAVVGTPYTYQFEGEEGCMPYLFSFDGGQLPPGLQVTEDGRLTGTPTEAGDFGFYVALDDHVGGTCRGSPQSQGFFELRVLRALNVTTGSLTPARIGTAYSATLETTESTILQWSLESGALPPGLTLTGDFSTTATISGTPTAVGSFTFTVKVNDLSKYRTTVKQYTLAVAAALTASSGRLGFGEVGVRYAGSLGASGGAAPFLWTVTGGALPAGLTLDAATGAIRGTPRAAGSFQLTFSVADASGQQATGVVTLPIAARLRIATKSLAPATVGDAYREGLATAGGLPPVRWLVRGELPPGIRFLVGLGKAELKGVAREEGTYRFTVRAIDRLGGSAVKRLKLVVTG
jgi:hypothetical protein